MTDQQTIESLTAELELYKRGAKTLGEIVDRQITDLLRWAGMEDQIGTDDPDQQTAWERVNEMPEKVKRMERVAAEIWAEEQAIQASLQHDPTNAHLSGALRGLQIARSIAEVYRAEEQGADQ